MKTRIVLLGPPASGKGTQAEKIQAHFGIPSVSPGAMLRDEMRRGTPLGIEADRLTREGNMAPDALVLQLVGNWLQSHSERFVFDGFPRTLAQADALEELLGERQLTLDAVLYFDLSMQTIFERVMNRLTCGECGRTFAADKMQGAISRCPSCGGPLIRRSDDTPEALEHRIAAYRKNTEPLVEYYRQRGILWTLKSAESPEDVFAQITSVMEAL